MAEWYSYNGVILPKCPHWYHKEPGVFATDTDEHILYTIDGEYYMNHTGYSGGVEFCVDTSVTPAMLWFTYVGTTYKLVGENWVKADTQFKIYEYITEAENIIWASLEVKEIRVEGVVTSLSKTYMEGSPPVFVSDYPDLPTVTHYGWDDGGDPISASIGDLHVPKISGEWEKFFRLSVRVICHATVPGDGVITVDWYKNGELWKSGSAIGSIKNSQQFNTAEEDTITFYAVVTHDNGEYQRSVTLPPINVIVVPWDLPNNKPIGGGDGNTDYPDFIEDGIYEEIPYVDDILVAIIPETVVPGSKAFYQVNVTGSGNYSKEYTVALSNQESLDTIVTDGNGSGNVWIAEDETADFVLLTATSVQEPLIQTSVMLYIDHEAVIEPEATAEQLQRAYMQGCATAKAYFGKLKIVEGTILSVDQTDTVEAPADIPSQLKRAYMQGFMSGVGSLAGKGKIEQSPDEPAEPPAQEPVAYLYNGVRLQKLPEWDKETYPHAVIVQTGSKYQLFLDTTFNATSEGKISRLFARDQDWGYTDGEWNESSSGGLSHYVIWTNKDLYYSADAGGGLFMEASEPVPVYE